MHGRTMVPALGLMALLASAGCDMPLSPRAQQQLDGGYASYQAGNNAATVEQMNAFIAENSHSSRCDEAYYLRGLARYNLKQYDAAKADLEQTVSHTKNMEIRAKAALALGDLSYDMGDMGLAENMYRHALDSLPSGHELGAQAYYRLGMVLQRQGQWRDADQQFQKVVYQYPNTEPARRAGRLINCNAWTIQAGSFAKMQYAQSAAAKFRSQKLPANAAAVMTDAGTRYVVQIGRYARFEEASAAIKNVRRVKADAFITAAK